MKCCQCDDSQRFDKPGLKQRVRGIEQGDGDQEELATKQHQPPLHHVRFEQLVQLLVTHTRAELWVAGSTLSDALHAEFLIGDYAVAVPPHECGKGQRNTSGVHKKTTDSVRG